MKSLAIIGTGIAGMGCGYFLHKEYDLTVFEQNSHIGGHTHTVTIDENGKSIYIDTGFMVYNDVTYPHLVRLFNEIDAEVKPTSMSFSVQHVPSGLEYCGSGLSGLFAQRKNIFNVRFIKMLRQIDRFNHACLEVIDNEKYNSYTLAEYVEERNYGSDFLYKYLTPMSSAVWSTSPEVMLQFPVTVLVRFFHNHGFLGLDTQHPWKTLVNGSQQYREKLIAPFKTRIHCNRSVVKVMRENGKAVLLDSGGVRTVYDKAILACHGDQALKLLDHPSELEIRLLNKFHYQKNTATLHTDASVMPKTRRAWSSWNYRVETKDGAPAPSTIYWMNSLQNVSERKDYFVSINDPGRVDPKTILQQIEYSHPLFSIPAIAAQKELPKLNETGPIYFCGSYFKYGFHEDAFTSALDACRTITGARIWS